MAGGSGKANAGREVSVVPGEFMRAEIREAPEVVRRQEEILRAPIAELAKRLRGAAPSVVVTCARGSSAHAATFGKHLIERHFGIPVTAAAPNIATVYGRDLNLKGALLFAISQSGRSDDLVEETRSAKRGGALTVALVNDVASPLALESDIVLPLGAGEERSIAATKSFIAMVSALLRLSAAWKQDDALGAAIARLPQRLADAAALDWTDAARALGSATDLFAIGRGPTLAIAREAALKLKETCDLHAEAFSGAEFRHGPVALVSRGYPILMFVPHDEAMAGMQALAKDLRAMGAALFVAEAGMTRGLPMLAPDHAETDAVCMIEAFYGLAVELAHLRGIDPDRPRHLDKVTRTR